MKTFLGYRLDTVNHCLWRGEERLFLAPKTFDVLQYLVEHSDRLVTQEEILEALWPEIYVNPEVIKKYVLGIRKVLGDDSAKPVFVATFPRRGYQFIAPLTEAGMPGAPHANVQAAHEIVGREASIAELDSYLARALKGQRQIVFITGEAGIGKTTLVEEFQRTAARHPNLRVIRGQCVEGFGGKEAYYPVLEALGQWVRDVAGDRLVHTLAKQAPTWLIQFPSLIKSEQREALQNEIFGATRERMVRELCEALESLTAQEPLVIVLEDLHWVDPSTLDLISALARRRGPARLLLFATYRPADVILSRSPLKALKQDLVIHSLGHEVSLERLEQPDVAEYISAQFPDNDFPSEFANLIYRRSGGNALFMTTILQDMVKKHLLAQVQRTWKLAAPMDTIAQSVPETLDQLIEAQFQQLSPVEQRVLRSASVAGEQFSAWAVSAPAEIDPTEIEDICEVLATRLQFIKFSGIKEQANGEISGHYDFRHSLYREVLYGRLSESTRSRLHLLLAQRLQSFCNPCEQELANELALHFEGGRDYEQAVNYLLVAANNAVGRFAYRDCLQILQHAQELLLKLSASARAEVEVRILNLMGDAQFALGALTESAQTYASAAARAHQAGLKAAQMHALTSAMYPLGFIAPVKGVAALDEAVKISRTYDDPARLALTQMLAEGFRLVFDFWSEAHAQLCISAYDTLLRLSPGEVDPYQRIVFAHVLMLRGRYAEALEVCDRSTSEASASGVGQVVNFLAHFGALSAKLIVLLRTGKLGAVLQIARSGRSAPDENMSLYWLLTLREAMLRAIVFDFEGAAQICLAARNARGGEFPDAQFYAIDQIAAGNIAVQQGNYAQALEHFQRIRDLDEQAKFFMHWEWRMMADLEASKAWLLSENLVNARNAADRLLQATLATSDPHLLALGWEQQAQVALAESDLPRACDSIQRALAIVDSSEIQNAAWQTFATASRIYRRAGNSESAGAFLARARSCVNYIADSFDPGEPLRAVFLNSEPVRRAFAASQSKGSSARR